MTPMLGWRVQWLMYGHWQRIGNSKDIHSVRRLGQNAAVWVLCQRRQQFVESPEQRKGACAAASMLVPNRTSNERSLEAISSIMPTPLPTISGRYHLSPSSSSAIAFRAPE